MSCKSSLSSLSLLPGFVFSALSSLRLSHNRARSLRSTPPCAFTLAEALIALVIIGIIAAITVPNLITAYQKQETVERLKKTYSALTQTTNRAIADNGPIESWEVGQAGTGQAAKDFFGRYLKPYLNILKDCGTDTTGDCEFKAAYLNSPNQFFSFGGGYERFYLADGTFIALFIHNYTGPEVFNKYATLWIDINGKKKPNVLGKDIFLMYYFINMNDKSFVPNGYNYSLPLIYKNCNKNPSTEQAGLYCFGAIFKSGWKIPSDYPW